MCGLTGFLVRAGLNDNASGVAGAMADRIRHRGPDDSGIWLDGEAGIALAHRRLSIVDLSAAGHQPMRSATGRWVLAYNGEIYNHLTLRKRLEAEGAVLEWRGHSDTETLLACIEEWGFERTLQASVGMFALALWDRSERVLYLARDRLGEKPLYYGWQGDTFLFGSELKALRAHPAFNAEVDRAALALLLRHNYIPAPYSIWQGINKLPPGMWLRLTEGQRDATPRAYWSLAEVAERSAAGPFAGSETEAIAQLEQKLGDAVRGQMMADVPLGALLSGGVDSSLIAALMQVTSTRPVRTFTIGFDEEEYDEGTHARAVAAHLGTDHTEMRLSADAALDLIPQLPSMYDEPFADSSQLPTHLVMKLARQHVTVALSGDGGDEIFGGYNRYRFLPRVWRTLGLIPDFARRPVLAAAGVAPAILGRAVGAAQASDKVAKLRRMFEAPVHGLDDLYLAAVSEWPTSPAILPDGLPDHGLLMRRERWPRLADPVARMMALDGLTYLPDDILAKVDRASMAVSLETRAPFLDRDVVEFGWSLPMDMKLRDGNGKWILRQLLERHVPRSLIERPKMGFGIPLDQWLRGPLRAWAEALLDENRLRREGFLLPEAIRDAWSRHKRGESSFGHRLWSVLMFQAWLEHEQVNN